MGNINGVSPTARVAVTIGHLEAVSNELRVHFGKKEEGTKGVHTGPSAKVFKTNSMKKMGPGYGELLIDQTETGSSLNLHRDLIYSLYKDYIDETVYFDPQDETTFRKVQTFQVPGANSLRIKMSYVGPGPWVASGLHEDASEIQGEYFEDFPIYQDYGLAGWYTLEGHEESCASCGCPVVNGTIILPPGVDQHMCGDHIGFVHLHTGPLLPIIERTIQGEALTMFWDIGTEPRNYAGYWLEIIPYDANGKPIENYQYIVNEIPYSYSPVEMVQSIRELNNYPNAEEVKF
jgi:hypothetical protein